MLIHKEFYLILSLSISYARAIIFKDSRLTILRHKDDRVKHVDTVTGEVTWKPGEIRTSIDWTLETDQHVSTTGSGPLHFIDLEDYDKSGKKLGDLISISFVNDNRGDIQRKIAVPKWLPTEIKTTSEFLYNDWEEVQLHVPPIRGVALWSSPTRPDFSTRPDLYILTDFAPDSYDVTLLQGPQPVASKRYMVDLPTAVQSAYNWMLFVNGGACIKQTPGSRRIEGSLISHPIKYDADWTKDGKLKKIQEILQSPNVIPLEEFYIKSADIPKIVAAPATQVVQNKINGIFQTTVEQLTEAQATPLLEKLQEEHKFLVETYLPPDREQLVYLPQPERGPLANSRFPGNLG